LPPAAPRQRAARRGPPHRASEERASVHDYWITSSARPNSDGGIVRPSALGSLEVDHQFKLVGCSTGKSAGFALSKSVRILKALKRRRRTANTLVVFTSDNGGRALLRHWPLVGKKMDLLEGGIRVPVHRALAREGDVRAASPTRSVITMDWVATFLDAAGVKPHPHYPLDGVSLLSVLKNHRRPSNASSTGRCSSATRRRCAPATGSTCPSRARLPVQPREGVSGSARTSSKREPKRLAAMRARYLAWEEALPKHPDATYFQCPPRRPISSRLQLGGARAVPDPFAVQALLTTVLAQRLSNRYSAPEVLESMAMLDTTSVRTRFP